MECPSENKLEELRNKRELLSSQIMEAVNERRLSVIEYEEKVREWVKENFDKTIVKNGEAPPFFIDEENNAKQCPYLKAFETIEEARQEIETLFTKSEELKRKHGKNRKAIESVELMQRLKKLFEEYEEIVKEIELLSIRKTEYRLDECREYENGEWGPWKKIDDTVLIKKPETIQDLQIPTSNTDLLIEQRDLLALEKDILTAINKTLPPIQAFKNPIDAIECFEIEDSLTGNYALQQVIEKLFDEWPGMSAVQTNQYVQKYTRWPLNIALENKTLENIYKMIKDYRNRERKLKILMEAAEKEKDEKNIQVDVLVELSSKGRLAMAENGKYNIINGKPTDFFRYCICEKLFETGKLTIDIIFQYINHGYANRESLVSTIERIEREVTASKNEEREERNERKELAKSEKDAADSQLELRKKRGY